MKSQDEDAIEKEAVQEILSEVKDEQVKQASITAAAAATVIMVAPTTSNKIFPTAAKTINKRLYFRNLVSTLREPLDTRVSRKRKIVGLDCNLSEEEAEEKRSKWQSKKLIKGKDYDPDTEYIYDARMYFDPEKAKETEEYRNARKDIMEQRHQFGAFEPFPAGLRRSRGVVRGGLHRSRAFPTRGFFTRGRFLKSGRFLQRSHAMPRGYPVGQYPFPVSSYGRPYGPWVAPHLQDLPYRAGGDEMMTIEGQGLNNDINDGYISSDDYNEQFIPAATLEKKSKKRARRQSCSSSDIIFGNTSASIAGKNERFSLDVSSDKKTKSKKKKKRVKKRHRHSSHEIKCTNYSGPDGANSLVDASYYHPMGSDCRETSVDMWRHDRYSFEADDFPTSGRRSPVSENPRVRSSALLEGEGHLVNSECEMSEKHENADPYQPAANERRSCGLESDNEISGKIRLRTKNKTPKKSKKKRKVKDLDDEERILIEEGKRLQEAIEQTTRLLYGFGNSEKYSVIRHYAKSYVQNTDTDDRLKVFLSRKIRRSCSEVNLFHSCPIRSDDGRAKDDASLTGAVENVESEYVEFRKKYRINRIIKQVSDASSSSDESHEGESACSMRDFDVSDLNVLRGRLLEAVNNKNGDSSPSSRESSNSGRSRKAEYSFSPEVAASESNFSQKNYSESSGAENVCDEDILLGHENLPRAFSRTRQRSDKVGRTSYENLQIMIKNSPTHCSRGQSPFKYPDEYKSLKDNYKDSVHLRWKHRSIKESSPSEKRASAYSSNRSTNYHSTHDKRRLDNGAGFSGSSYSRSNDIPVHRDRPSIEHLDYYEEARRSEKTFKSFPVCSKSYDGRPKLYANQRHDDRRYDGFYKGWQLPDRGLHSGYDISDRGRLFEEVDKNHLHWENRGLYERQGASNHSTRLEGSSWKADSRTASSCISMKKSWEESQNRKMPSVLQRSDRTRGRQDLKDEKNAKVSYKISRDKSHRPDKSNFDSNGRLQSKNDQLERTRRSSRNRHSRNDRDRSLAKHNHRSKDKSASQRKPFSYSSRDKSTSCDSPYKPVNRSVQSTVAVIVKPGAKSEGANKEIKSSKPIDSERTNRRGCSGVPSLSSYCRSDRRRN